MSDILDGQFTVLPEEDWKKRLTKVRDKSVMGIIEFGKEVYDFKQGCEAQQGGSAFQQSMEEWLGMSRTTAHRWANIGAASIELSHRVGVLPPSMSTMSALLALSKPDRDAAFKSGVINPDTTRAKVQAMKPKARVVPTASQAPATTQTTSSTQAPLAPPNATQSLYTQPKKWAAQLQQTLGANTGKRLRAMIEELPDTVITEICKGQT